MINLLGPIAPNRMGVIANTSSTHFTKGDETIKDIGQELGADYVLEGSIAQQGHTFHVSARLIRAADQNYVWGDEYDLDANYSDGAYRQLVIRIATQVATLARAQCRSQAPGVHQQPGCGHRLPDGT